MRNRPFRLSGPQRKRVFDLIITLLSLPVWGIVTLFGALLILVSEGRPVFYVSPRQVGPGTLWPIMKFRTMRRDADKILNRDTVPVTRTVFLNIPRDSPAYTPVGRVIERFALTELPQFLHVLSGRMSVIGCRPLPARVMEMLDANYTNAQERYLSPAGLTGPVQLIGREAITDVDRLTLEIEYSRIASSDDYRMRLDLWLLLYTVFAVLVPGSLLTVNDVRRKMNQLVARPVLMTDSVLRRNVKDGLPAP